MLSASQRAIVFWGVCIPLRTYLTYFARRRQQSDALRVFAAAIGFQWVSGKQVGNEGVFGGPAFWADERFFHGVLWSGYGLTDDWRFLAADTAFGAVNWLQAKN